MFWCCSYANYCHLLVVPKSGGHSRWSTIGEQGIIIDLSHYTGVIVNARKQTATLTGGVLTGEAGQRLAEKGLFTGIPLCPFRTRLSCPFSILLYTHPVY
jgi:FAD/FMN-containing dehydrogenase